MSHVVLKHAGSVLVDAEDPWEEMIHGISLQPEGGNDEWDDDDWDDDDDDWDDDDDDDDWDDDEE